LLLNHSCAIPVAQDDAPTCGGVSDRPPRGILALIRHREESMGRRSLIVYTSFTGNTEKIAGQLKRTF